MLFQLFGLFRVDPGLALLFLAVFLLSLAVAITVHEFSHALVAFRLGDSTAKRLGRLSLNPSAHIDPLGTLMLLFAGFGWGKPVPVNPGNLRVGWKSGFALVSLAGPMANLITAGVAALPIKLGIVVWSPPGALLLRQPTISSVVAGLLGFIIFYNVLLAIFNLIPLAPLDGFKVALGILPGELSTSFARTEQYGPLTLLVVIGADYFFGTRILGSILTPLIDFVGTLLVGPAF